MKRLFLVTRRYEEIVCTDDQHEDISDVWDHNIRDIGYQDQQVREIKRREDLPKDFADDNSPWAIKSDMTFAEIFEEMRREAWERRQPVHVITAADVGEDEGIFACIGRVQEQDVGKVIYRVDGIYQAENDEQRQTRRANVSDREMAKSILLEKLLAKQAEVTRIMEEIAGL
jgi:hypothetical protein